MISRRKFLGGAGALIALPALASLWPRRRRAEAAPGDKPLRFIAFYVPNGIVMNAWTPAQTGPDYALTPILQSMAPLKQKTLLLSGLANRPARPDGPGDHAAGTGSFLTCAHVTKTEGTNIRNGISLDQVIAAGVGAGARFPSLELGIDGGSSAGGCDSGYSCAYARNISWADDVTPLPKSTNPRVVFDRLFSGFDPTATAEEQMRRKVYKKSVLDCGISDADELRPKLSTTDRVKLDQYLTAVRELELRLDDPAATCTPGAPPSDQLSFQQHVEAMIDLMVLAVRCDQTRVITFMLGNAGSGRSYGFLGAPEAHHELSHHQDDPAKIAKLQAIDTWEVEQLASLCSKLDLIDDGDGSTALDNSAVFFSSEIEDGNSHSHFNMPIALVGGLGGALATGQHLRYTQQEPVANLFVSLLQGFGLGDSSFGDDGTGALQGVLV